MSRRAELEARRRTLLERCDVQRAELTRQLTQLRAAGVLGLAPLGAGAARAGGNATRHPLAWALAIGAILLLGRTREVLKILVWARTALALASRVAQVVRLVASWRAPRPRTEGAKAPARRAGETQPRARSASG
jgi:hypothetical protein